ncbi:MBL fold metallo-hydrolase [Pigmentibacter ruber]|uniref:MBL fold metallo-hydrolase n=1 Tax=Pigmentibacter ruber TaxID=2683196 RepID=UPI00131DA127|nr:MBL fold metallo-hydrolase [Pigmentibacter ruber]
MQISTLIGNSQMLDGGAMFGNAPKPMWEHWIKPDELNRIPLACNSLLIKNWNNKNILLEAGVGAFFDPKLKERYGVVEKHHVLLESLKKENLSHEDIHYVILSHLHFDHAGGILSAFDDGELRLLFPNAIFFVGKEQWERAQNPHSRDRASYIPHLNNLLLNSGRLKFVEQNKKTELDPFITFRFSNGHTPGLMLAQINLNDGPLIFASDLIPGFAWMHIPISMGYDRYPELVIDEKRTLLEEVLPLNAKIFFTHDIQHSIGKVLKDNKGKFYAEPYEYPKGQE